MFPAANDMSLVVYGLATFAATVGYACSRRFSVSDTRTINQDGSNSGSTSRSEVETHDRKDDTAHEKSSNPATSDGSKEILTRLPSLKRKRTWDDEHEDSAEAEYPRNLELIYPPKKRSRTPSSENESQEVVAETALAPTTVEACEDSADTPQSPRSLSDGGSSSTTPPPITPEDSPRVASEQTSTPPNVHLPLHGRMLTLANDMKIAGCIWIIGNHVVSSAQIPSACEYTLMDSEMYMTDCAIQSQCTVIPNAFSAFVGTSPFSAASPKPDNLRPAWSEPDLAENLNDEFDNDAEGSSSHALVAAVTSETVQVEHLTGEENEDLEQEIKGVKLFVKRGDRPFSDGMPGHLKLLSDKTTLDERLLFRREPLWQVSLNIRLHPSIRCTFDASEKVLRVIVTEPVENKDELEIVVYALKPGRSCSKQDFKEFVEAFLKSPGLRAKTES
ncbi:hypothetical protein J132_05385 [Termitomyces sp. J132]|nr:hypothetical protein J132_05385 [Termitomyces sp. J132]